MNGMKRLKKVNLGDKMDQNHGSLVVKPETNNIVMSPLRGLIPTEHEMMVFHTMAEQAVTSKMYKGIGEKAGVMMLMLSARELGISPMMALNGGLNIIQGKVEISARMMSALIRKSGHQIQVKECTATQCVLVGKRSDTGESQESSFSVSEAQQAGIFKAGGGWTKFPKDMCFARALSRLARQLFSDVIGIGYIEGEIGNPVETKPIQVEQIYPEETFIEESESVYIEKYISIFEKEDQHIAMEYLRVVQKHFEWSTIQTINELMKDQKHLFDRFSVWKNRIKKTGE